MPDDSVDSRPLTGTSPYLTAAGGSPSVDRLLKIVLLGWGFFYTGLLGLLLAVPPGYATAVWPPSGIALAGILLWDGLKHVNDTHGHRAGDALINGAARVLTMVFRESDVIARVGGDEFAVLALLDESDGATAISNRLREAIDVFNQRAGRAYQLSMSFGIEELDCGADVALEALLSNADRAMYRQKHQNLRQRMA
jgi:diguanylate cyclase (GGDEF)-like protein